MRAAGFEADDFEDGSGTYWPDTAEAVDLFLAIETQWRVGVNGRTGLDYCALYPLLDRMTKSDDEWLALLRDIQTMEVAALDASYEENDAPDNGQEED